jgi:hypothetical protein
MSDSVRGIGGSGNGEEQKGIVEYVFTMPKGEHGSANLSHSDRGFTATFSLPNGGTIQFGAQVTGDSGDPPSAA